MPLPAFLAPLLLELARNGLGTLASAIQAKGKEVVEETLGVKIPDSPQALTPELLHQLQLKQMEHEEFLIDAAIRREELDLKGFQVEVEEKNSARQRDTAFVQAGYRNNRAHLMFALAVIVVCALTYLIWESDNLNEYTKGIFTLVLGRFLGYLDNIYNFEFGTTRQSRSKDETIERLSNGHKR